MLDNQLHCRIGWDDANQHLQKENISSLQLIETKTTADKRILKI